MFEIYKRINSGGENLNDQQARKAAFWYDAHIATLPIMVSITCRHKGTEAPVYLKLQVFVCCMYAGAPTCGF